MKNPHRYKSGWGRDRLGAVERFYSTAKPSAETIKKAINPGAFYARELPSMKPTTRRGWIDGGLCPFHSDTRPGSWKINTESGAYRCFSCGAAGGDVLAFTQARHALTFPEALERLAAEWGIL